MPSKIKLYKATILAMVLVLAFFSGWELFCRGLGYEISFTDSIGLWSEYRNRLKKQPEATVIIGSSRVLFGIHLDTWEQERGVKPLQLALAGTSPLPILQDIAKEENFRGTILLGYTPGLFYALPSARGYIWGAENMIKYHNYTPSQRIGHRIAMGLEKGLVFINEEELGLNAWLERLQHRILPPRPDVFLFPLFAEHFNISKRDRQVYITDRFMKDTALQNHQKEIWNLIIKSESKKPVHGASLDSLVASVAAMVLKIQERGGEVIFVRMPSSNEFLAAENKGFPRELYWDSLLVRTGSRGYYFEDYESLRHFILPENSHLSPEDTEKYTQNLLEIMDKPAVKPVIVKK